MKAKQKFMLALGLVAAVFLLSLIYIKGSSIETFETELPPDVLWTHLNTIVLDSSKSSFWPNSQVSLKTKALTQGSPIEIVYTTPMGLMKQIDINTATQYGVIEYKSQSSNTVIQRTVMTVIPRQKTSALSIAIDYNYRLFNFKGWYIRLQFIPSFFTTLKDNLQTKK